MTLGSKAKKILFLMLLIAALFLPLPVSNLWWGELFNSGHTLLFVCISLVLYFQIDRHYNVSNQAVVYLLVLGIGLILSVVIELVQGLLQREASIIDIENDIFGMLAGVVLLLLMRSRQKRERVVLSISLLAFLLAGSHSWLQISWDYMQRKEAFPTIVAFGEDWSKSFIRYNNSELEGFSRRAWNQGAELYRVRFNPGMYPGISIIEPEKDWSGYQALLFDVFSENKRNINLNVRIHDVTHNQNHADRFNQSYVIRPGVNKIVIDLNEVQDAPDGRKLNLEDIAGFQLFLSNNSVSSFLEISNIFLKK